MYLNRTVLFLILSLLVSTRRRAERRLRAQREWLEVTLSSIGDGVIATDLKGRISFMNPVAEVLTGWAMSQASGNALGKVFKIFHEDPSHLSGDPILKIVGEGTATDSGTVVLSSRDGTNRRSNTAALLFVTVPAGRPGQFLYFGM